MTTAYCRLVGLLLGLGLALPAMAQRTWIVNLAGGPGVDHLDIPPAIAAAAAGDRIEVYGSTPSGPTYSPFVVDKPLDVEAMQGARVYWFHVENLAAGAVARVAGFRCEPRPTWTTQDECVLARNCAGSVLLVGLDVWIRAADGIDGFLVRDSVAVVVQDVVATGRSAGLASGGTALVLERSNVSLVRAALTGGHGGSSASNMAGYMGGTGLWVRGGNVQSAFATLTGGAGTYGIFVSGGGGDAVQIDPGSAVLFAGCTIVRGTGPAGLAPDGRAVDGPCRVTADCAVTGAMTNGAQWVPVQTLLHALPQVSIGGTELLTVLGTHGTACLLAIDLRHEQRLLPGLQEPFWLTPGCVLFGAGVLPGATTTLAVPVPMLAWLRQRDLFCQGVAVEAAGTVTLTPLAVTRIR